MRLTDFYKVVEESQIEKVAAVAPVVEDHSEELLKMAEEYVVMGRFMAQGYIAEMEKIAKAKEVVKVIKGATKSIGKNLSDAGKSVGKAAKETGKKTVDFVKAHPVASAATGAAIGGAGLGYFGRKATEKK